jgi:hypothetical protein
MSAYDYVASHQWDSNSSGNSDHLGWETRLSQLVLTGTEMILKGPVAPGDRSGIE